MGAMEGPKARVAPFRLAERVEDKSWARQGPVAGRAVRFVHRLNCLRGRAGGLELVRACGRARGWIGQAEATSQLRENGRRRPKWGQEPRKLVCVSSSANGPSVAHRSQSAFRVTCRIKRIVGGHTSLITPVRGR